MTLGGLSKGARDDTPRGRGTTRRQVLRIAGAAIGMTMLERTSGSGSSAEEPKADRGSVDAIKEKLPRTAKAIEDAVAKGGAGQLYVSLGGKVIADVAWGMTAAGAAVTPETLVGWASAVKPLSCTCLMKLWEQGKLDLDDRVAEYIPEFQANGKEDVRIRHLLTHTAHLGGYAGPIGLDPRFEVTVAKIIQAPRISGRAQGGQDRTPPPVGTRPGYNPAGIWIVAEVCRRLSGRDFGELMRREVFEPCGMLDSWCGMPAEQYRAYRQAGRIGILGRGTSTPAIASERGAMQIQPAGGGVGPSRELARFYETMLNRGIWEGRRLLTPQTVEAMTTPKTGVGIMGVWGLGFNVALPEGAEPASGARRIARFGPHASHRAFGHAGASGMQAFADPEYGLATAHIGRLALDAPIYEDLGLARPRHEADEIRNRLSRG